MEAFLKKSIILPDFFAEVKDSNATGVSKIFSGNLELPQLTIGDFFEVLKSL